MNYDISLSILLGWGAVHLELKQGVTMASCTQCTQKPHIMCSCGEAIKDVNIPIRFHDGNNCGPWVFQAVNYLQLIVAGIGTFSVELHGAKERQRTKIHDKALVVGPRT
jgi:hypothetical protein